MKKLALSATALVLFPGLALAQTVPSTGIGEMLAGVDTTAIGTDVKTWALGAVAVFLAILAIPLAKKLIGSVLR